MIGLPGPPSHGLWSHGGVESCHFILSCRSGHIQREAIRPPGGSSPPPQGAGQGNRTSWMPLQTRHRNFLVVKKRCGPCLTERTYCGGKTLMACAYTHIRIHKLRSAWQRRAQGWEGMGQSNLGGWRRWLYT